MVIKKSDVTQIALDKHKALIEKLEKLVDQEIESQYTSNFAKVKVNALGFPAIVIQAIKEKYIAAGWQVGEGEGSDQRDHESWHYLIFY